MWHQRRRSTSVRRHYNCHPVTRPSSSSSREMAVSQSAVHRLSSLLLLVLLLLVVVAVCCRWIVEMSSSTSMRGSRSSADQITFSLLTRYATTCLRSLFTLSAVRIKTYHSFCRIAKFRTDRRVQPVTLCCEIMSAFKRNSSELLLVVLKWRVDYYSRAV